jgi:D-glycero-alpha-D-manno-heptose 1-phosphate guanylyltransferase
MTSSFPEIIILAGGFGTRLQSVVKDVPKPMAPIAGKPFLHWLLQYISKYNPPKIILCTGYKHEIIEEYFGNSFKGIPLAYSIEKEPLGTGGAIKKAISLTSTNQIIALNGDTFFQMDYTAFLEFHLNQKGEFSMALKPIKKPARYGTVILNGSKIESFQEKNPELEHGFINTGVYIFNQSVAEKFPGMQKFSFESDFMEKQTKSILMTGYVCENYFIDIGIPEDFQKANNEFTKLFH